MKAIRWKMLVLLGLALLFATACTPAATPTATPAPTNTPPPPPPPTPAPSPTPVPPTSLPPTPVIRVEVEDPPEDGFQCVTGELGAASTPLPAVADVTRAWAEVDEGNQAYLFGVEFGRAERLDRRFIGGLHIYDAEKGLVEPFSEDWYFNNTTNWTLNFGFTPPDTTNISLAVIREGVWDAGETNATASIERNVLTFSVPIEEVAPNGTWGWGLTTASYSVCERVGYDDSNRPSLALPPPP
ncbi:MAG: hypothetical protein BMS9Abin28_1309 [Anaerolineae bacterium]|nr:MAG: hypothetical protein BMS9Abin28_1309 [Anaerolineae bacterium]